MAEPEWAKRMAQEFKAGRARRNEEGAELLEERRTRKESAYELWTDVREAFKHKAQIFNAAAGEEILTWEAAAVNTFSLRGKDIQGCVKGSYKEAGYQINIEVLGRLVPFQIAFQRRTGKYCVLGAGGKPCEPEEMAETLIGEFPRK
ncbi:MAG: hypothetical protein ABSH01_08620 [Terriglobia bacterium]|jgi:hypothetical protein